MDLPIKPGQDDRNILKENIRIPDWWSKPGMQEADIKTKTKMIAQRRSEFIPDLSYDLDGDGVVGNRDLVISKIHDKDKDGKLNAREREEAMRSLHGGIEKNFVWGVEQAGA